MTVGAKASARLDQLLRLAQAYRGWTRKQLAEALGRDPTRLVPESGNPKLDLVLDLARVMDWPVEDVAFYLGQAPSSQSTPSDESLESKDLSDLSRSAHKGGRYREAVDLAQQAMRVATTGAERAVACVRESSGWDGLGRYAQAMEATRRGLNEEDAAPGTRALLQGNLAIEHYTLWQLVEAQAIAHFLIDGFSKVPPATRQHEVARACSLYVRGHSQRRLIGVEQIAESHAIAAKADLTAAVRAFEDLASKYDDPSYLGVANTCRGGMIEVQTALGEIEPGQATQTLVTSIENGVDPARHSVGDELESYGWWCIFGCNILLRHVDDPREVNQKMSLLTSKADEVAVRLDNWSLRELVFTMDFRRRQRFADWTGVQADWTIDKEGLRMLTGTMGRFPRFQETGWQLIESSKFVTGN